MTDLDDITDVDEDETIAEMELKKATDLENQPALFFHCLNIYQAMLAKTEVDDEGRVIYTGFLTKLVTKELNLSSPMYSHSTRRLTEMGCIKQVKRGGGGTPSQFWLLKRPTPELFQETEPDNEGVPKSTPKDKYERLLDGYDKLTNRVSELETNVEKLLEAYVKTLKKLNELSTVTVVDDRNSIEDEAGPEAFSEVTEVSDDPFDAPVGFVDPSQHDALADLMEQ